MQLNEMKIIITGAAQGMGRHFALQLAEAGAQVAAGDVDEAKLDQLVEASASAPGKVHARRLDVSDEADAGSFIDWAFDAMGGLSGLVNNAGVLRDGLLVKKDRRTGEVVKLSTEVWNKVIEVNLTGASLMVRDVVAKMVETEQRPGVIVNMSSLSRHGNRGQSNYVAAKASLAANTVTWTREFAPFGIRVAAIAPGMIETPMTEGMNQRDRDALIASVPAGRVGEPNDVWLGLKFVLECDYFSGRVLDIDGGLNM